MHCNIIFQKITETPKQKAKQQENDVITLTVPSLSVNGTVTIHDQDLSIPILVLPPWPTINLPQRNISRWKLYKYSIRYRY